MTKKKKEKTLTRAKAKVRIQKTQANPALMDLKRQLRIEASLDRVRKKALSMKKQDDLQNICKTLYTELQLLGFDALRNSMINIHNDDNESFLNYDYAKGGPSITHFTYHTHPVIENLVRQMKSGRTAFSEQVLSGKKLKEFKAFRKKHGEKTDAKLRDAKALYYYFYSIGTGALGISNLAPLNPEQLKILKRFRNVFDLAYQRYTDIQKAKAQEREAQIQLALERVRARTMAMQHSNELPEAANLLFQQVQSLGMSAWSAGYCIWGENKETITFWMCSEGVLQPPIVAPVNEDPSFNRFHQAWERGEKFYVEEIGGEALASHYQYVRTLQKGGETIDTIIEAGFPLPTFQIFHLAYFTQGFLNFITFEQVPEAWDIFKRFAKVFEQTYTRFLDLQKAEGQARESQIEAALEKVRSRSLAMHSSDELREVVKVVFDKLQELNFVFEDGAVNICTFKEHSKDHMQWAADSYHSYATPFEVPYSNHSLITDLFAAKDAGVDYFSKIYPTEEKNEYFKYLFANSNYKYLPDEVKSLILGSTHYGISVALAKNSMILVPTPSGRLLTESEKEILKRFAKVFEQTYTRFLDLQKAEEQAREAQIEAALEKIRSRSLAMHHSHELKEVITVFFEKLNELGVLLGTVGIALFDHKNKSVSYWVGTSIQDPQLVVAPFNQSMMENENFLSDCWAAMTEKRELLNKVYTKEQKDRYFEYMFDNNDLIQIPATAREVLRKIDSHIVCFFPNDQSALFVDSWDGRIYSDESISILKRTGRVFEQAYIRFLDIQKAEAQAREAQIEAALEKVRSASMGMHHSDELEKVVSVLFDKLSELGLSFDAALIFVFDKPKRNNQIWLHTKELPAPINIILPYDEEMAKNPIIEDLRRGEDIINKTYSGQAKDDYYRYTVRHNESKIPENHRRLFFELKAWTVSFAAEKNSIIAVDSWYGQTTTTENFQILKRFARVFEQAYVRFLDLQNAEAQAREAQIEAALEKVRSSSMGMHHSDELEKVVTVLFDKLSELGLSFDGALIYNFDKGKRNLQLWVASKLLSAPVKVKLPHDDEIAKNPIIEDLWRAIENGEHVLNKSYSGKTKDDYFLYVAKNNENNIAQAVRDLQFQSYTISFAAEKNSVVGFDSWTGQTTTEQDFQVLRRFAGVFEQAYTRFLDLQRAEAQAREAQIQLALERLRARTMAMHHSSELSEAATLVFEQLSQLGVALWGCGFNICHEENVERWMSLPNGKMLDPLLIPYASASTEQDFYEIWKSGMELYRRAYEGDELLQGFESLKLHPSTEIIYKRLQEINIPLPTWMMHHIVPYKHGYLWIMTTRPFEETQIFVRFAKVFEQTYTRFLDLKNAEALARESQIQLALERIRARTMAMQKSDELKEVAMLLFKQVAELGITCWTTGFNVWSEDGNSYVDYVTNPLGGFMEPYTVDTTRFSVFREVSAARKKGETFFFSFETGERQKETYEHLQEYGDKNQFQKILESGFQFPSQQVNHFVFGEKVSLLFVTYDHVPEAHDIFKRFGKAFELTFTRFLDLEKAEAQARESQIQLALERVRARTMAMQKSEELNDVAILLFQQVSQLGIKTWTTGFNVWSDDNNSYTDYITSPQGNSIDAYKIDATEFPVFVEVANVRKSGVEFWIQYVEGDLLKETYRQLTKFGGEDFDKMLADGFQFPTQQYDHFVFGSRVSLMFITYEPVPEAYDIFKRFGKVFEQTYTRFLDLKKAEAQAREAQIEAALEKVRARTMGMQRSDELSDAAILMFQQIKSFGFELWSCGFNIWEKDKSECTTWMSDPEGKLIPPSQLPLTEHPVFIRMYESRKDEVDFYVEEMSGKGLEEFYEYLKNLPVLGKGLREFIDEGGQVPTFQIEHIVNFSQGNLIFITYGPCPDAHDIFKRFGKVFEQTYTRFLDLQKAEAQTREAQIEGALEKVRSSSLAMHHSDELEKVVTVLFDKLLDLGLSIDGAAINIFDKAIGSFQVWVASKLISAPVKVYLPYDEEMAKNAFVEDLWRALETGEDVLNRSYSGNAKDDYFKFVARHNESKIPDTIRKFHLDAANWTVTWATSQNSIILSDSWSGKLTSDEDFQVLKRFSRVFEQAYTRFIDLQKAEAQTREAQIEAALERVRSRTMAMHKSEELHETGILIFRQIESLNIPLIGSGIHICHKNAPLSDAWMIGISSSDPLKGSMPMVLYDHTRDPLSPKMYESWKSKSDFLVEKIEGEQLRQHFDYISSLIQDPEKRVDYVPLIPSVDNGLDETNFVVFHFAYFSHGFLVFAAPVEYPENHSVFKRFAKVFEQTYTRFLDLQKAEAQAREAQIEAALERVRSRTMAMHKSEELLDVITVVSEQLQHVGIKFGTVSFGKNSSSFDMDFWVAAPDMKSPIKMYAPYTDIPIYNRLKEAYRERRNYFSDTFTAEETKIWNQHFIDHNPELFSEKSRGYLTSRPGMTRSTVLLKNVFLFLINYDFVTYSDEEIEIVIRFAKVFEQTYTRFLDLQKAEAQAREAQIEAALERLRSRTMAMQRSTELAEVSQLLHQQFLSLGVQTITCAFMFPDEDKKTQSGWTVLPDGTLLPRLLDFPLLGDAILDERYRSWKEKRPLHRKVLDAEENRRHHQFLSEQVASHISKDIFTQLPDQITFTNANFAQGYLMIFTTTQLGEEEENILVRFAKVFEQTYTRFLDLQKAEAQAREAQIEAALERIRSRSLAMHHSGELKDVVAIMFEKMKELNVVIGTIAIQLFDEKTMSSIFWAGNNLHNEPPKVKLPYYEKMLEEDGYMKDSWECKKKGENLINREYTFEQKTRFFDHVFASNDLVTISEADRDVIRQSVISPPNGHIICLINEKNSSVFADSWNGEFYSEESIKVLIRAAKVFEQAYVRFLDLQKAEAQARESQIEASLERVRARTMAMHKSEELLDVIVVVSQQLSHLDFRFDVVSFARNSEMHDYRFWFCLEKAQQAHEIQVPYLNNPMFERIKGVMARGEKFFADTLTVAENREWIEHMLAHDAWPGLTDEVKNFLLTRGYARSIVFMPQIMLILGNYFLKPYSEEQNNILKRFAAVFEQSYTRFLDLQKAEAQARESQIEAALERVRAKAMAMHTAQQLKEVVHELRKQMGLLGQKDLETCVIHLNDDSPDFVESWAAMRLPNRNDESQEFHTMVPKRGLKIIEEAIEGYTANRRDYVLINDGAKLDEWMKFIRESAAPAAYPLLMMSVTGNSQDIKKPAYWSLADFQGGSLIMVTLETPDENSRALLRRFTNVFGLAYRRFADLKQAEAQAREATIEAALEKIRSRSLGMHKSEEILDVVAILFGKLKELGLVFDGGAAIMLFSEGSRDASIWVTDSEARKPIICNLPYDEDDFADNHLILDVWKAREKGESIVNKHYPFEQKNKYFQYVFKHNPGTLPDELQKFILEANSYTHTFIHEKNSMLGANSWTEQKFSDEDVEVLKRVARVFEQAYVRFLDLQRAEAQAREANIEAALEKIRSRSLGMHKSAEILDVVAILFGKLKELGLVFDGGAAIHLYSEGSRDATIWVMSPELSKPIVNTLPYDEAVADNPIIQDVWKAKDTGQHITNRHYSFEEKREYFEYVFKHNAHVLSEEVKDFIRSANSYTANFIAQKNSLLGASSWTGQVFSESDIEVLKRVAHVFEQAYIRFLDLQKAEIHAKEAVCQASLDRVRAEIASMRTVEDLDRITPLIWRELNTIGIPFIRCGVFIMDEPNRVVQTFLSTPDGKAIAAFQLPFNTPGRLGGIVPHWQDKKIFLDYWDDAAKKEVADTLVNRGIFSSSQQYLDTLPKEGFHLHCLPFAQGMLYVANLTQLKDEELNLLQSLADAFATAYARYDDFNKLESAKQQVDRTLVDLKQAQQQLVQSEKMASLGELTAGIAHEIQNPLNFVNNFAEVSNELIDEMAEEVKKGNFDEVKVIANDLKQNLEKINHHGKRADGIVKSMLQHSRTSSGQKELTDINVLCDEYLRLSYHGLRAKDKSFNAKFETDFDSTLEKINVLPQDIGRVILNLINNAFYAVTEKRKTNIEGYEPTVSVSTKQRDARPDDPVGRGKVEITVKDNGNGISQKVLDKIFQPFFTTKPTGQGTGLGLSLSYDIVKAHGGELTVETKEEEGTEFVVSLPV